MSPRKIHGPCRLNPPNPLTIKTKPRKGDYKVGATAFRAFPKGPKYPYGEYLPKPEGKLLLQKPYFVPYRYFGPFGFGGPVNGIDFVGIQHSPSNHPKPGLGLSKLLMLYLDPSTLHYTFLGYLISCLEDISHKVRCPTKGVVYRALGRTLPSMHREGPGS